MHRIYLIVTFLLTTPWLSSVNARQTDPAWLSKELSFEKNPSVSDTLNTKRSPYGTFAGHLRSFSMGTINHEDFPDYYAQGVGAGLGWYSPIIGKFQVAMSGFFMYNLASSPLGNVPPFNNRYEVGLFDVLNPDNRSDLGRVENLYLRYIISKKNKSYIQVGKFGLKTPMMNPQDGRMIPNLQEGVWADINEWKKVKLKGGWLWGTSPRSTVEWLSIGESIGVYPLGRSVNGTSASYAGKLRLPGIAIAGINYLPFQNFEVSAWNYTVPELLSTSLFNGEWKKQSVASTWSFGGQYLFQQSLYQGRLPVEQQYISEGDRAHAYGIKIGRTSNTSKTEWSLNYTRITPTGRFLFPREWGIEPFFTFMNRERMEGAGDVHAFTIKNTQFLGQNKKLSLQSMGGVFLMPALDSPALNKYNMPSFYQLNLRAKYSFSGFFSGLQADLMYVYKGALEKDLPETPANFHNKVDMHHISLVFDYYF
ncbi:MAG: OprD family outer membrane porin [Imperialibacter sp.]